MPECCACIKTVELIWLLLFNATNAGCDLYALQLENQRVVRLFASDKASEDADVLRIISFPLDNQLASLTIFIRDQYINKFSRKADKF